MFPSWGLNKKWKNRERWLRPGCCPLGLAGPCLGRPTLLGLGLPSCYSVRSPWPWDTNEHLDLTSLFHRGLWSGHPCSVSTSFSPRLFSVSGSVPLCLCNTSPQTEWLKQHKFTTLQFWREEFWNGFYGAKNQWQAVSLLEVPGRTCVLAISSVHSFAFGPLLSREVLASLLEGPFWVHQAHLDNSG